MDLSRMARTTKKFMQRYSCGLDDDVNRIRAKNKMRILDFFEASDIDWDNWKWHTRRIIRNADTLSKLIQLTDDEYQAIKLARENNIPFGITPYYLSLMDYESHREKDYAVRSQVIPPLDYVKKLTGLRICDEKSMDFMLEKDTSPTDGITRRYPNIVIFKPIMACPQICVYCQRNWEIEDVHSPEAALSEEKQQKAIQWIQDTPEINEVLITGGGPIPFIQP